MAFHGCEFIFNGISSRIYNLVLYNTDGNSQGDAHFPSVGEAHEDRIPRRYSALHYGNTQNEPLTFTLVFGLDPDLLDQGKYLNRTEIATVSSWLTGHQDYRKLQIVQNDMIGYFYKCYISDLKLITNEMIPYAFSCTVTCDSPFAYIDEYTYSVNVRGSKTISIDNDSTYNGYYMPHMKITAAADGSISIINHTDNDRTFLLQDISSGTVIDIDNENQIIHDLSNERNLYQSFNYMFFRMKQGVNDLTLDGNFDITFTFEFPANIGA